MQSYSGGGSVGDGNLGGGGGVPSGVRVGVEGIVVGGSSGVVGIIIGDVFGLARCSRVSLASSNRFWVPLTMC